mgnify:CR=1 FL=1
MSRAVLALWNIVHNLKPLKILVPLKNGVYAERIVDRQYRYAVSSSGYVAVEPPEAATNNPPLLTGLRVSIGPVYACTGFEACRDISVSTILEPSVLGLQLPRLLVLKDAEREVFIENYVPRKPGGLQIRFQQLEDTRALSTTFTHLYSGVEAEVYNPFDETIEIYLYRVDSKVRFDLYGKPLAKYTVKPGTNNIALSLEPGIYVFVAVPKQPGTFIPEYYAERLPYIEAVIAVVI